MGSDAFGSLHGVTAYSLTISVPTGDPDELRVVGMSNWIGKGLQFSRNPSDAVVAAGLDQPGIYLLTGDLMEVGTQQNHIYIGESENISRRLRDHQKKSALDFWTRTLCFTASNKFLNKGHLRYIESQLLRRARETANWHVANENTPGLTALGESDEIAAKQFLDTATVVSSILGVSAFRRPTPKGGVRLYLSGPDSRAEGEEQAGGFLVMSGSLMRKVETPTLQDSIRDLRARLLREERVVSEGVSYRLVNDHLFSSPSTAAAVLLGRSANGRTEWKDRNGTTLRDLQAGEGG